AGELADDLDRYLGGDPIQARSLNLVSRIAAALERSHYDVQFQAYGNMLLGLAVVMIVTEVCAFFAFDTKQPFGFVLLLNVLRYGGLIGLLLWYRPSGLRPV